MQVLCHPGKLIGETKIGMNFVRRTGSLRHVHFCVFREITFHSPGEVLPYFSPAIFIRDFIQNRKEHRDIPQWIHDQDQGQGRRKQVHADQPSVSSCQTRRDWSSFNDEHWMSAISGHSNSEEGSTWIVAVPAFLPIWRS